MSSTSVRIELTMGVQFLLFRHTDVTQTGSLVQTQEDPKEHKAPPKVWVGSTDLNRIKVTDK